MECASTHVNISKPLSLKFSRFIKVGSKLYFWGERGSTGAELWEFNPDSKPIKLSTTITQTGTIKCNADKNASLKAAVLGGTTPYQYLWSTGATSEEIASIGAGIYNLTVTGKDGSSTTSSVTITEPTKITVTTTSKAANPQFKNGNAVATVTGGTSPYSYAWNTTPTQSTATATNLIPGTYSVTVTDNNSCKNTATVSIATSTNTNEIWEKYHFEIFPNPTSDVLNIKLDGVDNQITSLNLFDASGKLVATHSFNLSNTSISISHLPSGVYTLKCKVNEEEASAMIIKN
jgi:hypothetical protein